MRFAGATADAAKFGKKWFSRAENLKRDKAKNAKSLEQIQREILRGMQAATDMAAEQSGGDPVGAKGEAGKIPEPKK